MGKLLEYYNFNACNVTYNQIGTPVLMKNYVYTQQVGTFTFIHKVSTTRETVTSYQI